MADSRQDETQALRDMITAGWRTRVIYEGVRTGLFDGLGDQPKEAATLAAELGLDEATVFRVLRALATLSLCEHVATQSFVLTPRGALLQSDTQGSLRSLSLHWGGRVINSLGTIGHTLETGEPGQGGGDFAGLHASPFDAQAFNRTMADQSRPVAKSLAQMHDFSGYDCVMDVGGGFGGLLTEVLLAYPKLQGVIYDLAAVAPGAEAYLAEAGVSDRAEFIGGSFFEKIASIADCLVLKFILHDWNDGECAAIMAKCREAMKPGEHLLIVERIMPELAHAENEDVVRQDMVMMPINGKERTLAEFEAFGLDAGFTLGKVTALVDGCSLIEMSAI